MVAKSCEISLALGGSALGRERVIVGVTWLSACCGCPRAAALAAHLVRRHIAFWCLAMPQSLYVIGVLIADGTDIVIALEALMAAVMPHFFCAARRHVGVATRFVSDET